MKDRILLAEKKFDIEKLINAGTLELNLQLSPPPDGVRHHQPSKYPSPHHDYSYLMHSRKEHPQNADYDLPKRASVRVNAVAVNVSTKHV